ncbi:F-box domain-containing protein [Mycena indigotica]|uniref:F-box domain-containing protein n=1 Tax=Mycena indigotica TaxID=2126181 RepID=A0A8H6VXA7_9AGAR|nr:F-box domain-containing protein [Mycena indigotica]KAF7297272.1 F-box domain-containing protein [Mycena indigotica]
MDRPYLPTEIICTILCFLEVDDLLRCDAANRFFHAVVQDSSRLQFNLELAKHRMLSLLPPTSRPSFSSRLKLICERERNWRSPQLWGPLTTLTLPPTGTVYEFVGSYYANGWEDDNKLTSGITFFELPSTESPQQQPLKTWTHAIGSLKLADFTMDPAQDLLVLVALAPPSSSSVYNIHLRSFKTNEPHPESSRQLGILPCLPRLPEHVHQATFEATGAVRVQVAGDLVALLVKEVHDSVSAHLQIWNWRYGGHHSCSLGSRTGIEDFTFLTDNTFLIVRPTGRFECYTFENPVGCSTTPVLKSSYNLPPLEDGYMYWYICMSSNPAPGYLPKRESSDHRVYYPRPEERIHACCLYIFKPTGPGDHRVHSFVFFLNVKMFLEPPPPVPAPRDHYPLAPYLTTNGLATRPRRELPPSSGSVSMPSTPIGSSAPTGPVLPSQTQHPARTRQLRSLYMSSGGGRVRTVPWEEWGSANTRWFDDMLSTDWQHALYGLRTVECVDEPLVIRRKRKRGNDDDRGKSMTDEFDEEEEEDILASPPIDPNTLPTVNDLLNGIGFHLANPANANQPNAATPNPLNIPLPADNWVRPKQRYLRIRDYNPYTLRLSDDEDEQDYEQQGAFNRPAKAKRRWTRRLVTTPSTTASRGVFAKDIVSALPYAEVVSRERYNVTDVMMDDCRILLMQRGRGGTLQGIDVLTM